MGLAHYWLQAGESVGIDFNQLIKLLGEKNMIPSERAKINLPKEKTVLPTAKNCPFKLKIVEVLHKFRQKKDLAEAKSLFLLP